MSEPVKQRMARMLDELADGVHNGSISTKSMGIENLDPATEFHEYSRQLVEAAQRGDIPRLTTQELGLLTYIRMGLPVKHAVRASGMAYSVALTFLESDPRALEAMEYAAVLHTSTINVTAELLTAQAYEERARAANATEGLKALEVIAKLNNIGAYAGGSGGLKRGGRIIDAQGQELENGHKRPKNKKQLEQMSDEALLANAGLGYEDLEPSPVDYSRTTSDYDTSNSVEDFDNLDDIEEADFG